uniref:BRCT domain-containing protein n=1 Tax=Timema monikensis TaxID=170555 RepID=A0A7R9DZI4_9NEOP|nr:unnamed protein product [Timema monikensis]
MRSKLGFIDLTLADDKIKRQICGSLSEDPKKYQVCGHVLCSTCAKPGMTICPKCGAPSRSSEITTDNFSKNFLLASRKVSQLLGFTSEQLQADEDEAGTHSCGKQGTKKPSVRGGKSKAKKLEQLATGSRQRGTSTRTQSEDMSGAEDGGRQRGTSTSTKSEDISGAEDGGRQKRTSTRTQSEDISGAEDGGRQKSTSTRTKSEDITDAESGGRQTPATSKKRAMTPAKKDLKRNAKGETPLHVACIKGNAEQVKALLETGVTPNTKDNAGWTPLHEAASHGYTQIVRLLLESGALPSVPGVHNATPLHDAVSNKLLDIVRLLVKFGADPLARDSSSKTPRDYTEDETMLLALEGAPVQALPSDRLAAPTVLGPSQVFILASELDPKHLLELQQLAQCVRIRILRAYTNEVTHVVTNVADNNTCSPSLAILHGILQGKWIVNTGWITACNKAGHLVDPQEYEVLGTIQFPNSKTPQSARINAQKLLPSLFNNCHIFLTETSFVSAQLVISKTELAALVKAGGGKILSREPDPEFIPAEENLVPYHAPRGGSLTLCSHYIIYPCGPHVPQMKYNMKHIKTLSFDWLLKCIETFSLVEPFY